MSAALLTRQLDRAYAITRTLSDAGLGDALELLDVRDGGIALQVGSDVHVLAAQMAITEPHSADAAKWRRTLRGAILESPHGFILIESHETIWRLINDDGPRD